MTDATGTNPLPTRLVIVLTGLSADAPEAAAMPFRYAATAAAMDVGVEMHAVGRAVTLFRRGTCAVGLLEQIRSATALGASIFVCPQALVEQGLRADDLIEEVSGVRGAASMLGAGLEPGARFLSF